MTVLLEIVSKRNSLVITYVAAVAPVPFPTHMPTRLIKQSLQDLQSEGNLVIYSH